MEQDWRRGSELFESFLSVTCPNEKKLQDLLEWSNDYPLWRHPFYKQIASKQLHSVSIEALFGSPLGPNSIKNASISRMDISGLLSGLHEAFTTGDYEREEWDQLVHIISMSCDPKEAVQVASTTIPIPLYSKTYDHLFDITSLQAWMGLLEVAQSRKPKSEFVKCFLAASFQRLTSEGPRSDPRNLAASWLPQQRQRAAELVLKAVKVLQQIPACIPMFGENQLGPELKSFCLAWIRQGGVKEAQQVYSALSVK